MQYTAEVLKCVRKWDMKMEDLTQWQAQVLANMGAVPEPEHREDISVSEKRERPIHLSAMQARHPSTINVVYNSEGCTGRTTFLNTIKYHNPESFIIFQGVPSCRDFDTEVRHWTNLGFNGHCIVFDIHREFNNDRMYRTLELASDVHRNVWVFTYRMPDLSRLSHQRWNIFTVHADVKNGIMSDLIPLSLDEAHEIYLQEKERPNRLHRKATSVLPTLSPERRVDSSALSRRRIDSTQANLQEGSREARYYLLEAQLKLPHSYLHLGYVHPYFSSKNDAASFLKYHYPLLPAISSENGWTSNLCHDDQVRYVIRRYNKEALTLNMDRVASIANAKSSYI